MGSMSLWHWLIVGALALLLFGGKSKISDLMGDVAKGIKSFKKGMAEDDGDKPATEPARTIDHAPAATVTPGATATPVPPVAQASVNPSPVMPTPPKPGV